MISFPLGHNFASAAGGQQTCYSQEPFWSLLVHQAVGGVMKGIIHLKQILQYKDHCPEICKSVLQGYSALFSQ